MRVLLLLSALMLGLAACSPAPQTPVLPPTPTLPAPVDFAAEGLTGRIIYAGSNLGVWELNPATGAQRPLFQPADPANAWVTSATVSPDGRIIVMAYAPPPAAGQIQFGFTDLYELVDGAAPRPLLQRVDPHESFFTPTWSPDGRQLYYAHAQPLADGTAGVTYNIERRAYPDGAPERVSANAFWPRLSPDGSRLVYVSIEPETFANGLMIASAEGSAPKQLIAPGLFAAIDAPLISPDGTQIIFSAAGTPLSKSPSAPWGRLFDAQAAEAHNLASDWWQIPVEGGQPQPLTQLGLVSLFGDFSPDGQVFAFLSLTGLYLMQPDGTQVSVLSAGGTYGTLEWVP